MVGGEESEKCFMENQEKQHKRRVRYSGTHPISYKEKYKEHNPEKYADTIERLFARVVPLQVCIFLSWFRKS